MTSTAELAAAIERMIDEKVAAALERRTVTPSGLRIAANLSVEQLLAAVNGAGAKLSANQLRRYESGMVDNVRHKSVQMRMAYIAGVLGVSTQTYQDAVLSVRK